MTSFFTNDVIGGAAAATYIHAAQPPFKSRSEPLSLERASALAWRALKSVVSVAAGCVPRTKQGCARLTPWRRCRCLSRGGQAVARGCQMMGAGNCLSTTASLSIEDVAAASPDCYRWCPPAAAPRVLVLVAKHTRPPRRVY